MPQHVQLSHDLHFVGTVEAAVKSIRPVLPDLQTLFLSFLSFLCLDCLSLMLQSGLIALLAAENNHRKLDTTTLIFWHFGFHVFTDQFLELFYFGLQLLMNFLLRHD